MHSCSDSTSNLCVDAGVHSQLSGFGAQSFSVAAILIPKFPSLAFIVLTCIASFQFAVGEFYLHTCSINLVKHIIQKDYHMLRLDQCYAE